MNRYSLLVMTWLSCLPLVSHANDLSDSLAHPERDAQNQQRDEFRHPVETLAFFNVTSDMTVIEIWPGKGWYTELLAPWIKQGQGQFIAAGFPKDKGPQWRQKMQASYESWLAASPQRFDGVEIVSFGPPSDWSLGEADSVDAVLTFRNVHNWVKGEYAEKVFQAMFNVLKPGGILGVVDHRAVPDTSLAEMNASGYLTEALVIALAEQAGFVLDASSDINNNAKDTKDHPKGVWTLPPTLRLGEQDKQKYLAIGESDRMTLRFRKP